VTRSLRRWTTLLCLAGFAFSQLTLAAYACPLRAPAEPAMVSANVDANCHGHADTTAPESGPLCEVHCQGQNGVPGGATLSIPPPVLAPFPVALAMNADRLEVVLVARTPLDANAAAPPLTQRFCRLLI
jgi:hypothetical protein